MRAAMLKLAGLTTRRRWIVVGIWVALIVVAFPLAAKQTENLTGGGFDVPGSESQAVQDALAEDYPERQNGAVSVVLEPATGDERGGGQGGDRPDRGRRRGRPGVHASRRARSSAPSSSSSPARSR